MHEPLPLSRDRFRGALLGLAVGDALGAAVEFERPGTFEPVTDMTGGGPFGLQPGEWTDDTAMALCLAESLVECGRFDAADQMKRYVRWYRHGYMSSNGTCFDIGNATREALERFEKTGVPYQGAAAPDAAGNGPLMKLAPVPLAFATEPLVAVEMAAHSARATHGDPRAIDATRYLAGLILGALNGAFEGNILWQGVYEPVAGIWDADPLDPEVAAVAAGSFTTKEPPEIRGKTFVVPALEAALWAFTKHRPFEAGALAAANLGDDADTTAAIYGQIAGAHYGADAIPDDWLKKLARREEITRLADGLYDMAVGAAPGRPPSRPPGPADGPPEPGPPPGDGYWILKPHLLAGEYPGSKTLEDAKEKLSAYLDFGVTVFIDLTEEGEGPPLKAYEQLLGKLAGERGMSVRHFRLPIPDLGVPEPWQMGATLGLIAAALSAGERVYVHCWGGVGRTGTVAGCALREFGVPPEIVIDALAEMRKGTNRAHKLSPETAGQRDFVLTWDPGPETIVLNQEQIDELGLQPVLSDPEPIPSRKELEASLRSGPESIDGPGEGWCVQGLLKDPGHWFVEVLNPVRWETGPALPEAHIEALELLGFEETEEGWATAGPATLSAAAEVHAAEMMLTVASRVWGLDVPG